MRVRIGVRSKRRPMKSRKSSKTARPTKSLKRTVRSVVNRLSETKHRIQYVTERTLGSLLAYNDFNQRFMALEEGVQGFQRVGLRVQSRGIKIRLAFSNPLPLAVFIRVLIVRIRSPGLLSFANGTEMWKTDGASVPIFNTIQDITAMPATEYYTVILDKIVKLSPIGQDNPFAVRNFFIPAPGPLIYGLETPAYPTNKDIYMKVLARTAENDNYADGVEMTLYTDHAFKDS